MLCGEVGSKKTVTTDAYVLAYVEILLPQPEDMSKYLFLRHVSTCVHKSFAQWVAKKNIFIYT